MQAYIADYKKLGIGETWEELLQYLPEAEQRRIMKYRQEPDRIRALTGAVLILSHVRKAIPGEGIRIERTELGKPYAAEQNSYFFNLSHSGNIIAYVEDSAHIGIDVERVKDKDWRIFHRYLSDSETSMIEQSADPAACFFEVWTVREAFAKEEGAGLKILDEEFIIDYEKHTIDHDGKRLHFKCFDHLSEDMYKISICSVKDPGETVLYVLTPDDWEECTGIIRSGIC